MKRNSNIKVFNSFKVNGNDINFFVPTNMSDYKKKKPTSGFGQIKYAEGSVYTGEVYFDGKNYHKLGYGKQEFTYSTLGAIDPVINEKPYLYVGEFYRKDKYDTDPAHHMTVGENEMNYALCYAYKLDTQGSTDFVPEFVISIPNQVQGLCLSENKLFISTSWAISDSHLLIYENWKTNPIKYQSKDSSSEIDLYVLNNSVLAEDVHMPPMSEEVDYIDGKVYISFESAGKKYKSINVFRQENVLAFDATR